MQAGNFKLLSKLKGNAINYGDCFQGNNSLGGGGLFGGRCYYSPHATENLATPVVLGNKILS